MKSQAVNQVLYSVVAIVLLSIAAARTFSLQAHSHVQPMACSSEHCDYFDVGGSAIVSNEAVLAWSREGNTGVEQLGVDMPYSLIESPPSKPGKGPNGAIAVVPFSCNAKTTTYFNHVEVQWDPHSNAAVGVKSAHYELRFSTLSTCSEAKAKPAATTSIAHANGSAMLAGLNKGGQMDFVAPIISRAALIKKQDISLPVPQPKTLGQSSLYPHKFIATYDTHSQEYHFYFSDFRTSAAS